MKKKKDPFGNTILDLLYSTDKDNLENEIETNDLLENCFTEFEDDPVSKAALLEFAKGHTNKEVAEELELPVSEIENCKKRIKRKVGKLLLSS